MKCLFLMMVLFICCGISDAKDMRNAPIEEQLALLNIENSPRVEPAVVNRFKLLLNELVPKHKEARKEIANLTVKAQGAMKEKGVNESLIDIMESINRLKYNKKIGKTSYLECVTMYAMLRSDGMSRTDASKGMNDLFKGVSNTKK